MKKRRRNKRPKGAKWWIFQKSIGLVQTNVQTTFYICSLTLMSFYSPLWDHIEHTFIDSATVHTHTHTIEVYKLIAFFKRKKKRHRSQKDWYRLAHAQHIIYYAHGTVENYVISFLFVSFIHLFLNLYVIRLLRTLEIAWGGPECHLHCYASLKIKYRL